MRGNNNAVRVLDGHLEISEAGSSRVDGEFHGVVEMGLGGNLSHDNLGTIVDTDSKRRQGMLDLIHVGEDLNSWEWITVRCLYLVSADVDRFKGDLILASALFNPCLDFFWFFSCLSTDRS